MALPAHVTNAVAGLGLDEGTRPELVDFGSKNLAGANVRMDARGMLGKRYGYTAMSALNYAGVAPSGGIALRMVQDRNALMRFADREAHVYSATAARWLSLGRAPEAGCRLVDVPCLGTTNSYLEDIAIANGYVAISWISATSSFDAYLAIVDEATGALVRIP
jgi:hypothetical protein